MTSFDRIISATVKSTGELLEYNVRTAAELTQAYDDVLAHMEAYRVLKNSLMSTSMEMLNRNESSNNKEKK